MTRLDQISREAIALERQYERMGGADAHKQRRFTRVIATIRRSADELKAEVSLLAENNLQEYGTLVKTFGDGTCMYTFVRHGKKKSHGEYVHSKISQINLTLNSVFIENVPLHLYRP